MQFRISKGKKVSAGDFVRIRCRMRQGQDAARLNLYSRVKGYDFAPHVQASQISLLVNGRPQFVAPMGIRLTEFRKEYTFEFLADEALEICVMQEKDDANETSAIVSFKRETAFWRNIKQRFNQWKRYIAESTGLRK